MEKVELQNLCSEHFILSENLIGRFFMQDRRIISFHGIRPQVASNVFLADGVRIAGSVVIEKDCGIWFNTVIRGDVAPIKIERGTNIQDNSTVHVGHGYPCTVGKNVTVGHNVLLHGCTVGDNCLIGMGSILLNGCEIGENSIVAAGSMVTQKKKFPSESMIMGSPAKVVRKLTQEEIKRMIYSAGVGYQQRAKEYKEEQ